MAYSRRNYLTIAELEQYADITVTNEAEAIDQINQAEELIDAYVGPQKKSVTYEITGVVKAATATTLTLEDGQTFDIDYLKYCELWIVRGTGEGQKVQISSNTREGNTVTLYGSFSTIPDTSSMYKIVQIAKFPRKIDHTIVDYNGQAVYAKSIPEGVTRAVAAQIEFVIAKGADFFKGRSDMASESIGDYSYQRGKGQDNVGIGGIIAPKSKALLRPYLVRYGNIII